jgi:hypothetical protein
MALDGWPTPLPPRTRVAAGSVIYPERVSGAPPIARCSTRASISVSVEEVAMYHYVDGWDWIWMTLMMGFWVVILALVVYLVVKLTQGDRGGKPSA